jgi:hypothetical protein
MVLQRLWRPVYGADAGKYSTIGGAGTVGASSELDCQDCKAGKYLSKEGKSAETDCIKCSAGKYMTSVGAGTVLMCEDCPDGTYSSMEGNNSPTFCLKCAAGKYANCEKEYIGCRGFAD